ncbi:hypothetical protein ABW21_db0206804 [Orbilia brochopaga]|nr:hypothetical protein ABW21_db0206804 [Drechslerella brochopaga]
MVRLRTVVEDPAPAWQRAAEHCSFGSVMQQAEEGCRCLVRGTATASGYASMEFDNIIH